MDMVTARKPSRVTLPDLGCSYFVETAAEAGRVVDQLIGGGYVAYAEPLMQRFVVHVVTAAPSVTIEEIFVRHAPSARSSESGCTR
jgi:hypothetical protein